MSNETTKNVADHRAAEALWFISYLLTWARRRNLQIVESLEVSLIDFCRDLIALLNSLQNLRVVDGIGHRHGRHPSGDTLIVHNDSLGVQIDLLDFALKLELLLSLFVGLLAVGRSDKQTKNRGRQNNGSAGLLVLHSPSVHIN